MGQWIRICPLMQGTQVRSLVQEDFLALGKLLEPMPSSPALDQEKPQPEKPVLHSREETSAATKTQHNQKQVNYLFKKASLKNIVKRKVLVTRKSRRASGSETSESSFFNDTGRAQSLLSISK